MHFGKYTRVRLSREKKPIKIRINKTKAHESNKDLHYKDDAH